MTYSYEIATLPLVARNDRQRIFCAPRNDTFIFDVIIINFITRSVT
jgi:hypothetical protein